MYRRPRSVIVVQVRYAALDVYASVLFFCFIMKNTDPVLTCSHPAVQDLAHGIPLRLYTRTNSRFVAEGSLVSRSSGEKWGCTKITVRAGRAVVRLTKIHVRTAWMLYPNKLGVESRSLQDATIGELVLWDVVSCRLS